MSLWDNVAGALPQGGQTSGFWGPLRPAVQAAVAPQPSMGTIGQPPSLSQTSTPTAQPGMPPQGVTRRGSQMVDAQGNVIGHYDDNNQPVYTGGQGPMQSGPKFPGQAPLPPLWDTGTGMGFPRQPQGPVASTSMGMAPSWQRMAMPGGRVQDVPSAYAPQYLQQGGSLTGESTQYPAYSLANVGRSGYR